MAWLVEWDLDAGTSVSLCVWRGGGRLEYTGWGFGYNEKTGSHTLSPSRRQQPS